MMNGEEIGLVWDGFETQQCATCEEVREGYAYETSDAVHHWECPACGTVESVNIRDLEARMSALFGPLED